MDFDPERAKLKGPDFFPRFRVEDEGTPIEALSLPERETLIVWARGGERRAVRRSHLAYHHLAQGKLAGEPYLVTF